MRKNRIEALIRNIRKNNNIEALLIAKPENIFYLTSFPANKVVLVIGPEKLFVITDFIFAEAASRYLGGFELHVAKDSFTKAIAAACRKGKIKKLGFESLSMSCHHYYSLKRELKAAELIPTENIIESLREIKDGKEIAALKKSLKIAAETFKSVKKRLSPKSTELSISRLIKETLIKKGADGYPFEPIVATQPSASQPHYAPASKRLGRNKAILLDIGARLGGYNSDLTRVCRLGKINSKFVSIYNILIEAQRHAIEHIKPGVRISEIDLAARQLIENKGLGKFFGHALGHGIGLEIHEGPSISHDNRGILREGMVFTVEPGIYIPGFGGLRVEDMVRVDKKGCEILSDDIDKSI